MHISIWGHKQKHIVKNEKLNKQNTAPWLMKSIFHIFKKLKPYTIKMKYTMEAEFRLVKKYKMMFSG